MQIPQRTSFKTKLPGASVLEYVKCEIKYLMEKYKIYARSKEFAISKIPLEVEVPKIFSKFLSFKISGPIKVTLSNTSYKLLSIELNKVSNIVLIVSIIICVTLFCCSIKSPLSQLMI